MQRKESVLFGLCLVTLTGLSSIASAEAIHIEPVRAYIDTAVRSWIEAPQIVEALKTQNDLHAHLTHTAIAQLDAQWRAEFGGTQHPLIDSVAGNPLSLFLKEKQAQSNGVITEIFVIDAKGLNVGLSEVTSDYWQGDEAKWQKTYLAGAGMLFIDKAEKDDSTQMLQSQANLTVSDPATGQPIGAITVGVNLDAL